MRAPLVYSPAYVAPLPPRHRFPMPKFRALLAALRQMDLADDNRLFEASLAPAEWLRLAHTEDYVDAVLQQRLDRDAERRLGFPVTEPIARRSRAAVAGTAQAARLALEHGLAFNLAGGSHHAYASFGSGFCVFNDVVVAARLLIAEGSVRRVLVVDLDVHQGDGTAAITEGDPAVSTLSVHCRTNFPARKQRSDIDIALDPGIGDDLYLQTVESVLPAMMRRTAPDLVFYNAGVDPHQDDRLGRLALTDTGLVRREHLVLSTCRELAVPLVGVVGGGYGDSVEEVARRHAIIHRVASQLADW